MLLLLLTSHAKERKNLSATCPLLGEIPDETLSVHEGVSALARLRKQLTPSLFLLGSALFAVSPGFGMFTQSVRRADFCDGGTCRSYCHGATRH